MTKNELINKVSKLQKNLYEAQVHDAMDILLSELTNALKKNERIEIRGFGSFSLRHWGPRYARNPETGESWRTKSVYAVHFRPAQELRSRVESGRVKAIAIREECEVEEVEQIC